MPPLINSEETRLTVNTKNVFIDATGFDETKLSIVINTLVTMFSVYCLEPFTVEYVEHVTSQQTFNFPTLEPYIFQTNKQYINSLAGTSLNTDEMPEYLSKMGYKTKVLSSEEIEVSVTVFRNDVLHPCDIGEDLAIAFGFNRIPKNKLKTVCKGFQQPINKLTDIVRSEMANCGYVECLTFSLFSKKDMFDNLLRKEEEIVSIYESKTKELEVVRNSLIPGILKSVESNKTEQVFLI